jgi:3-deoxy-D-manno-octulosonate 8-phosphate phosphatase KdsC-like HAD superfamily phosphatase
MRLNVHTTVGMVCGKRTCGVRDRVMDLGVQMRQIGKKDKRSRVGDLRFSFYEVK